MARLLPTWLTALLGISTYTPPPSVAISLDDEAVERARTAMGGQLQPLPASKTRWYERDIETAQFLADAGDLSLAAKLARAYRRDGVIKGLQSTRTGGLIALPRTFGGRKEIRDALETNDGVRPLFDEMFPPAELALLAGDGIDLGVGVAELVPVLGRDFPVLRRLDPEFLRFRWNEGRWFFRSITGEIPITPGDGRWVLHVPGGHQTPWNAGLWPALGKAYVEKEHARLHRNNYSAKLANPARAAIAPPGASENQRAGFLKRLIAWGVNTVFELPVGWDVKLIESNGRGFDVFTRQIETSDHEAVIAIAGQEVTVTGGAGFSNADIHQMIRADIIAADAAALAYTLNTQGIPPYVIARWGIDALVDTARVAWDTTPPADRKSEAEALRSAAEAMRALTDELARHGKQLDAEEVCRRFGVPVLGESAGSEVEIDVEVPANDDDVEEVAA